jgi:hypothetical protein
MRPPAPAPRLRTSSAALSRREKLRELARLGGFAFRQAVEGRYCDQIRAAITEYDIFARRFASKALREARVLDIGFGARPWRAAALDALGADVWGVDLDRPVLRGSPRELLTIYRDDGAERALKSAARFFLLDGLERRGLERRLGLPIRPSDLEGRLISGDASDPAVWESFDGPFDLLVSEDVFEHVPVERIAPLCRLMAAHMTETSVALVRPFVFTGISGGHLAEWFAEEVDRPGPRRAEPWEHLRGDRYRPNTFLNRLRLRDYRRLFSVDFEIVEERPLQVDLGRQYLTPEIRAELANYEEEELLSNNVLFVLRRQR